VPIVEKMVDELKARPFSMVMILGLYLLLLLTLFTNYGLASEPQVQGIAKQVQDATVQVLSLTNTVKRTSIDQRIDQKRSELFTWEQKVLELNTSHKPVDPLYAARISALTQEISDLQKERDLLR
jgi:hypothetical protein